MESPPEVSMRSSFFALIAVAVCLVGCGAEPAAPAKPAPPAPQSERERLINNTQAASAVGYDGEALKASVQKTVETLDQHAAETQKAVESVDQPDADANK
jgi:hypothetical protein